MIGSVLRLDLAVGSLHDGRVVPLVHEDFGGDAVEPLGDPLHVLASRLVGVGPQTDSPASQHLQGLGSGRVRRPCDRAHGGDAHGLQCVADLLALGQDDKLVLT